MSTQTTANLKDDLAAERDVADYLQAHPDFFERHLGLLAILKLPHPSGSAVSLVERQLGLLRDQNQELKHKLMELVHVARDNDRLTQRMHRLTLALMECGTVAQVLHTLEDSLRTDFDADRVAVLLFDRELEPSFTGSVRRIDRDDEGLQVFGTFFKLRRPLCGRLKSEQIDYVFGEHAGEIGSAVLIALGGADALGMLAVGSADPQRFHPGLGKVYLTQLGELVSTALQRCREAA